MRKMLFFLLLLPVVFGECKKKSEDCVPYHYQYTYKNNSQVDTLRNTQGSPLVAVVNTGTKKVFTYTWYSSPCHMLVDGGAGATLVFEVDSAATSFNYFTNDLAAAHCYYQLTCVECFPRGAFTPFSGTIEGTRTNGTQWNVQADLKLTSTGTGVLQFSGVFTPAQ